MSAAPGELRPTEASSPRARARRALKSNFLGRQKTRPLGRLGAILDRRYSRAERPFFLNFEIFKIQKNGRFFVSALEYRHARNQTRGRGGPKNGSHWGVCVRSKIREKSRIFDPGPRGRLFRARPQESRTQDPRPTAQDAGPRTGPRTQEP